MDGISNLKGEDYFGLINLPQAAQDIMILTDIPLSTASRNRKSSMSIRRD